MYFKLYCYSNGKKSNEIILRMIHNEKKKIFFCLVLNVHNDGVRQFLVTNEFSTNTCKVNSDVTHI